MTINIKDRPLPEALAIIESRVPVRFAYPTELLRGQKNVSIMASEMPLHKFLDSLFRQTTLTYHLIGDQVVLTGQLLPAKTTLSGYVRDAHTGELLIGASVYLPTGGAGVLSNNYGFYSLTVEGADSIDVEVSYVGYKSLVRRVVAHGDVPLSFDLLLNVEQEEINKLTVVNDKREDFVRKNSSGMLDLGTAMIAAVPSVGGSGDLIGSVEMLPGVQAGIDGTPGYFVRGGNAGQNLILLDDATLYNPSHIFGLVSVFNPATIKHATLMKGGFPASYGDHVSSVLDIAMKDGSNQQTGGVIELGSVSSGATLYGPLEPGKSSFLVSGRRSTTDFLLHPILQNNYFSNYYFYDVNAKLNFQVTPHDRLLLSFYSGRDNNNYSADSTDSAGIGYSMHFGNTAVTARWNHQFSGKLFVNTSVEYNNYHQFLSATQQGYFAQLYSGIRDIDAKTNFSWYPSPEHKLSAGVDYLYQTLYPATLSGQVAPLDSPQTIVPSGIPPKTSSRLAVYAGDDIKLGRRWQAYVGIRAPYYYKPDAQYFAIEPRLALLYLIDASTSVKVSYTTMHQYIHLVQSYNATFPAEIWIGSSSIVQPQVSQEISAGLFKNFSGNDYQTSLEVYYKHLDNQLLFGGGPTPAIDNSIESQLIFGKGWDYGAEFYVRKNRGRLTGWLAYTLAYAYEQFDSLNEGQSFPFAYDRRHVLDITAAYSLTPHWKVAANFLLASGRAFSLSPDSTFVPGNDALYSNPGRGRGRGRGRNQNPNSGSWDIIQNNYRLSPYNRLDLSIHYAKTRTTARRVTETEWIFSVFNVYARPNNSFVYRTIDPATRKVVAKELPLIPVIPSITYTYKF
ncbi:TonB-dependent receptor [Puia dinghuensis]|uniref:TonB-dependent receptor n=1 Tax=Puia dinghuensis TaxID=1792502 RepID=A0A8J2UIJ5_9BACT|nr:TonB-dependent receptor [Puia dinghuensis]